MTNTPRTDAAMWGGYDGPVVVDVKVCQQLERDLNAANKRIVELEALLRRASGALPTMDFVLIDAIDRALEGK